MYNNLNESYKYNSEGEKAKHQSVDTYVWNIWFHSWEEGKQMKQGSVTLEEVNNWKEAHLTNLILIPKQSKSLPLTLVNGSLFRKVLFLMFFFFLSISSLDT